MTCCPSCGHRQAHIHIGWVKLPFDTLKLLDGDAYKFFIQKLKKTLKEIEAFC
jgi:hypothetical protein